MTQSAEHSHGDNYWSVEVDDGTVYVLACNGGMECEALRFDTQDTAELRRLIDALTRAADQRG